MHDELPEKLLRVLKILESEKLRLLSFLSFFFSFLQEPLTGNKSGPDTERVSNYTRGQILGRVKPRLLSAARQTNFPCNDLAKQAQSVYMSSPASTLFEWRKRAEKRRNLIMITVRRGSEDLAGFRFDQNSIGNNRKIYSSIFRRLLFVQIESEC